MRSSVRVDGNDSIVSSAANGKIESPSTKPKRGVGLLKVVNRQIRILSRTGIPVVHLDQFKDRQECLSYYGTVSETTSDIGLTLPA